MWSVTKIVFTWANITYDKMKNDSLHVFSKDFST